jgi:hypothetical protein
MTDLSGPLQKRAELQNLISQFATSKLACYRPAHAPLCNKSSREAILQYQPNDLKN